MIYLFYNSICVICSYYIDTYYLSINARKLVFAIFFFSFVSLPAFQYEVGADYHSYTDIYLNNDVDYYYDRLEIIFASIINLFNILNLPSQSLFIIYGLLFGLLMVNATSTLSNEGLSLCLLVLLYFTVTSIYQNQLNGIRNFLAVYFFINAIIFKFKGNTISLILFTFFGILSHSTFYLMIPFLILSTKIYEKICHNYIKVIISLNFLAITSLPVLLTYVIVDFFAPHYSKYFTNLDLFGVPSDFINSLPKLIWTPVYIWSLFVFRKYEKNKFVLNNSIRYLYSFWILTSYSFYLQIFNDNFFRFHIYCSFFSIIPFYLVYQSLRSLLLKVLLLLYIVSPYIFKVTFFARDEYNYTSVFSRYLLN